MQKEFKSAFHKDEYKLLNTYLHCNFVDINFTPFKIGRVLKTLEIIVTPECNQQCEYCYLHQHGHDSYPMDIRADKETTLNNIRMLMDYMIYEKKWVFQEYELFAGDLFTTGYFFDIMDLLYPYFEYIYKKAPELFHREMGGNGLLITIPTNLRFIEDDEITQKVLDIYDKFQKLNITINFSWSHDGKYCSDQREGFDLTDEHYEKAFKFLDKTGGGIHPMMSPEGTKYAIQNHKWWQEMFKRYMPGRLKIDETHPFHLEVRNDGWTDESISNYLKYLKYRLTEYFNLCNNEIDKVAYSIFNGDGKMAGTIKKAEHDLDIFHVIVDPYYLTDDSMTCMLQKSLIVRASDLAIVPCHRLTYHQFIGGWFIPNEDRSAIVDIEPNNVGQLIMTKSFRTDLAPVCATCWNKHNCLKGCLGAQFEWSGEMYLPILSVCKFQKAKTSFIIKMFAETGILDSAFRQKLVSEEQKKHFIKLCEKLGYNICQQKTN